MKASIVKKESSKKRRWLRRILMTLAVLVFLPIGLFTIGWLNRDAVIQSLQNWYSENNSGTLTIGTVNANFLSGFPNVRFTLKDIQQTNTDSITDQFSSVKINEVKLTIGAGDLLSGNIKFKKIHILNATVTSELNAKRSLSYYEALKQQKNSNKLKLPSWLNVEGANFTLEKVIYIAKDSLFNKYFNFEIHQIKGFFKGDDTKLVGNAFIDITVNNLGFNTKKGSFFNGARISGRPKFTFDLKNNSIAIQEFEFKVDDQNFKLSANFDLSIANSYSFDLQNSKTDFNAVKRLLTDSLAVKIKSFDLQNPIRTHLDLSGTFDYDNDPDVNVEFSTEKNAIVIADKFHFKNTTFKGFLTTDIYKTDSLRAAKKTGYDIKIAFNHITATIEDVSVDLKNAFYQSTPTANNFVEAEIELEGSNEALATLIETDNFDFRGGTFKLDAIVSGNISNPYQFLNKTTGTFNLNNTNIILKKNGLQLPIQTIDLTLEREHSTLNKLIVNLPNDKYLMLKGELKNISGLISQAPHNQTISKISIDSDDLNVNEIVSLAKSFLPKSSGEFDDRKTLHETLETVYNQFHPQFRINLDALELNEVTITDLKSTIDLINSETIQLRNFNFKYDEAETNLKGRVVVHGPESRLKDAIYMDAEANSSGPITVFQDLFNITLFRIDDGAYAFHGNVTGNVKEFDELLSNTRGDLKLKNIKLFYEPAESDIIIDSLSLYVNHSDILLDNFDIEVGALNPINLSGSIKQFPAFLLDNSSNFGSVDLKIAAPYFDGDDLLSTISSFKANDSIQKPKNKKALHQLFKDINKFNPTIELAVDSLKYKDLITEDITAKLNFENDSILNLDHLDLRYKSTTAKIYGNVNAHTSRLKISDENPFDINFSARVKGKSEDLNAYLKTTNFIFKSGDFEFSGDYNAKSEDLTVLNSKTYGDLKISHTLVDFKDAGLQIPVDSLHIAIIDDVATLKTLDINLPGKSSIYFEGAIDHFSDFINNSETSVSHSSNFSIRAPYLDTADIETFLENTNADKDTTVVKAFDLQKFKDAMVTIHRSFYPTVTIEIDTLRQDDFKLTDFGMHLLFDTNGNFKVEDTQLNFYGGSIRLNADVGVSNTENLPVTLDMQANNVNLHELVTRFDYFNDADLRNAERIEGLLNYSIKATGTVRNDGTLNTNSLNGTFEVELNSVELFNYKPIMDNSVLMKDERFAHLRFQPIIQTFEIINGEIIIPRTEIQSSAIQVFVEGRLKLNESMDIWLALPWKTLKSNDGLALPEKTTYDEAGSKFYVQLLQNKTADSPKNQKLKVKIRLSDRKLRKEKLENKE